MKTIKVSFCFFGGSPFICPLCTSFYPLVCLKPFIEPIFSSFGEEKKLNKVQNKNAPHQRVNNVNKNLLPKLNIVNRIRKVAEKIKDNCNQIQFVNPKN